MMSTINTDVFVLDLLFYAKYSQNMYQFQIFQAGLDLVTKPEKKFVWSMSTVERVSKHTDMFTITQP